MGLFLATETQGIVKQKNKNKKQTSVKAAKSAYSANIMKNKQKFWETQNALTPLTSRSLVIFK